MQKQVDPFAQVNEVLKSNMEFLEKLLSIDLIVIDCDAAEYLSSQLKKDIGTITRILVEYERQKTDK